jgi:N-carbamoyl-L-amino-acid hydrolase
MINPIINGERLWRSLMDMAGIGATEKGGVCRLALTDLDRQARDLFVKWCLEAGCSVSVDRMGNIFARRCGSDDILPPVMTGSHMDTQPTGGRFDGVFGVMAGLEIIRTLNECKVSTKHPLEVVVWTNEEGSRFAPCMIGSGVFAGVFSLEEGVACRDADGKTIGGELARIGFAGERNETGHPVTAYFEAHIEQGPILEKEGKTIGVVTGALGQRWFDVVITGQESHAGPTPMQMRRDALVGAARVVTEVNRIGNAYLPEACATVGSLRVFPDSRNVIPGSVYLSVDFRHIDAGALDAMEGELQKVLACVVQDMGLTFELIRTADFPPTRFAPECIDAVRRGAMEFGFSHRDIVSGAGHDSIFLARIAPSGMVFVPCENGISHNEIENADPSHLAAGCNVLLRAMLERAILLE